MTDIEHLTWIYERLLFIHKENPNFDYMLRLKKIVETYNTDMQIDKQDIINMIKGVTPAHHIMNHILIKPHGSYTGGFNDEWNWRYNSFDDLSEVQLKSIYALLKNPPPEPERASGSFSKVSDVVTVVSSAMSASIKQAMADSIRKDEIK